MSDHEKVVDGFRFMSPSLRAWIGSTIPEEDFQGDIPWTPVEKPIDEMTFALLTSSGINMKSDSPFDVEREKKEPAWGDPSMREIPKTAREDDIDVNHLHINTEFVKRDMNVMLPLARFREFEEEGIIGKLAPTAYSYYGFQMDPTSLIEDTMPKIVAKMKSENVDTVLLTPA